MDIQTLKVEPRKAAGSRAAARLRKAGKLPGIVYGHKIDPEPVVLNYKEFETHLHHGVHLVNLDMGGKAQSCLIKDVQYDHLGSTLLHVDLARVDLTDRVTVHVPLELKGTAKGVSDGGVLRQEMMDLEVECPVASIPEAIRIVVTEFPLDFVLHVKEIQLPPGVTPTADPETVVLTVRVPVVREAVPTAPAEGGPAEPEVIAKGKVETEEGEGEEKK